MSDGVISQDEIDALLSSVDGGLGGLGGGSSSGGSSNIDTATLQKFADKMKDKLVATFNGTTGKDAFTVGTPTVEAVSRDQLLSKVPEDVVAVMADYKTALTGDHLFVFAPEFVQKVGSLVDPSMEEAMVFEVIKEIVGGHSGSEISDLCAGGKLAGLETIPPEISKQPKAAVRMPEGNFALFSYPLTVEGTEFTMWEAISSSVAEGMTKSINGGSSPSPAAMQGGFAQPQAAAPQMMGGMNMGMGMQSVPMGGMNMGMGQMAAPMPGIGYPNVQSVQFQNLNGGAVGAEQGNISLIMDVSMEMTVELGRTKKQIKDILGMGEGTIIELDKLAGEPVDILVNHKPIAKGEVVVIDENFGVRVTEILSPAERVNNLR